MLAWCQLKMWEFVNEGVNGKGENLKPLMLLQKKIYITKVRCIVKSVPNFTSRK